MGMVKDMAMVMVIRMAMAMGTAIPLMKKTNPGGKKSLAGYLKPIMVKLQVIITKK